jgi:hypothetical protein
MDNRFVGDRGAAQSEHLQLTKILEVRDPLVAD